MMYTGWPPASGPAAIRTAIAVQEQVGDMEMGVSMSPTARSACSCITRRCPGTQSLRPPRASEAMALTLSGNGVPVCV
eukprot:3257328-Prymnesium_polylepis.1